MRRRYALKGEIPQKIQKQIESQIKKSGIGNNIEFKNNKLFIDNKEYIISKNPDKFQKKINEELKNSLKSLIVGLNQECIDALQQILKTKSQDIIKYLNEELINQITVDKKQLYIMEVQ